VTSVTDIIPSNKYSYTTGDQEITMSLLQQTGVYQGSKEESGHGFVLALIAVALVLVLAAVMFTPEAIGGDIPFVGP
jgi:hypothetical protein